MKTGDAVSFTSANGAVHSGHIVSMWQDGMNRTWTSVMTPESRCPFLVAADELTESK